ncbi:hypothetical protein NDU88_001117 [Pleurodeles waltl]|uniref:Uncharacterized protein n=1 Tax=Pleurodeles waltl TaxID=8319 RepID=A0AAV7V6X5_PLEWA|nr:hypothetical protein NDU88_001117 [Pleurodeles waltl]
MSKISSGQLRQAVSFYSGIPENTSGGPPGPAQPAQLHNTSPPHLRQHGAKCAARQPPALCHSGPPQLPKKRRLPGSPRGSSQLLPIRQPNPVGRGRSVTGGPGHPTPQPSAPASAATPQAAKRKKMREAGVRVYRRSGPRNSPPATRWRILSAGAASPCPRPASQARTALGKAPRASCSHSARPSSPPPVLHSGDRAQPSPLPAGSTCVFAVPPDKKSQKNLRPDRRNVKSGPQAEQSHTKCRPSCWQASSAPPSPGLVVYGTC